MRPQFCKAVDPIFLYVLELLERINASEPADPQTERDKIRGKIDQAETRLGRSEAWELAKYSLVSWVDEMLGDAPWDGAEWWRNNILEFELFKTAQRSHEFYNQAKQAAGLTRKDALECFYIAVILGFRGMYRTPDAFEQESRLLSFDAPGTLQDWAVRVAGEIKVANDVPPPPQTGPAPIHGAPWHEGKFVFIGAWVTALILGAITALILYQKFANS